MHVLYDLCMQAVHFFSTREPSCVMEAVFLPLRARNRTHPSGVPELPKFSSSTQEIAPTRKTRKLRRTLCKYCQTGTPAEKQKHLFKNFSNHCNDRIVNYG